MASSAPEDVEIMEPGLYIQLQEPNRGYRPGQTISGRVVHCRELDASQVPVAVTLTVQGLAKAKITSHKKYESGTERSRLPLVNVTVTLRPSVDPTWKPNEMTFPFAVSIPDNTQTHEELQSLLAGNRGYWDWYPTEKYSENDTFLTMAGESLPPTIRLGPRGSYIRSEAFIEYKLIATLSHVSYDGRAPHLDPFQHTQCGFWMVGAPADPDYPECKIDEYYWFFFKTYRLDPRIGMHTDLTLRQRSKMMTFASEVPAAVFFSNAWSDSMIGIGKEFNVKVSISVPGPTFERPAKPQAQVYVTADPGMVEIESVRVRLNQQVKLRAGRYLDQWDNHLWEHTFTAADIANTLTPSRTHKNEPVWQMRCGPVPKSAVPTVRTGNIAYRYAIHIKVKSRCAGNARTTEVNLFPICRYADPPPQQKIRRKPVGGAPAAQAAVVDELADLGPYHTDPEEIPNTVKALDTFLRGFDIAGKAGHIAHGVAGAVSILM